MSKLTAEQIKTLLGELPNWSWNEELSAITCSVQFRNFSEAFAFMARVALLAEKAATTLTGPTAMDVWTLH